jgi:hypothetical protein
MEIAHARLKTTATEMRLGAKRHEAEARIESHASSSHETWHNLTTTRDMVFDRTGIHATLREHGLEFVDRCADRSLLLI